MKLLALILFSILCLSIKAQTNELPAFEKIDGVSKTVMNPKLYPLLLKVHLSEKNTNTNDFKNFIGNLKQFEVFSPENETSGDVLLSNVNSFLQNKLYKEVNPDTYELVTKTKKEYIIIKRTIDKASTVYAFTTKPDYNDIENLKLL